MKRFLIAFLLFLLIPVYAMGEEVNETEYENYLNLYDFSFFENTLGNETYSTLKELGLDGFSYESLYNLSLEDIKDIILKNALKRIKAPAEGVSAIIVIIILSSFFQSIKSDSSDMNELYSTVSALVIAIILCVKISDAVNIAAFSIGTAADFVYAFIPVFCAITAASGGLTVSFSTNSTLLVLSQALSFLSSNLFMPLVNCFLAVGIVSSLRPSLKLGGLIEGAKRAIISAISFTAGTYVSILSLKTSTAAKADTLGIRSVRFAINSVVPVVGGALSEGLASIQTYSSLIKSSVGTVGIIAVLLVFLPPLTEIVAWRIMLGICTYVSEIFENSAVSALLRTFCYVLLIMNVLIIVSALATVVSIGIITVAGK